jgi:uncharacterized protein (TIGR02231 family)
MSDKKPSDELNPPPLNPHVTTLSSSTDGKIVNVNLYSGRAEITRLYTFDVRMGMNNVCITELPHVMDQQSLRVEGRGAATIHGVTVSSTPAPPVISTSDKLCELEEGRGRGLRALGRNKQALAALNKFLDSLDLQKVPANEVGTLLNTYKTEAEKLDEAIFDIQAQLSKFDEQIAAERKSFAGPERNSRLSNQASVGVFADVEGTVEIALIYAVYGASWEALYDIRVDMNATETPVSVIYKAAISQDTGENWDNVPLTLETVTPTFGVGLPTLNPWKLSVYKPPVPQHNYRSAARKVTLSAPAPAPGAAYAAFSPASPRYSPTSPEEERKVLHREAVVDSRGTVSATFRVPGMISIPSDGDAHNVTITQLALNAKMSWICVPKEDTRVHLNAKVKNASEYTLLPGSASVYVDGSFISRSDVPPVSPQESFDCPLGIDSSIRVTYHPLSKKVSHSGFYNKNTATVFSQRITIHNTKNMKVEDVKLVDQFPVSEDSNIKVKISAPGLVLPGLDSGTLGVGGSAKEKAPAPVSVGEGIIAQWDGAGEDGVDVSGLGKEGKFNWICAIPAQEKVNLLQSWEVSASDNVRVIGL